MELHTELHDPYSVSSFFCVQCDTTKGHHGIVGYCNVSAPRSPVVPVASRENVKPEIDAETERPGRAVTWNNPEETWRSWRSLRLRVVFEAASVPTAFRYSNWTAGLLGKSLRKPRKTEFVSRAGDGLRRVLWNMSLSLEFLLPHSPKRHFVR
jgi:hypothetical protein